MRYTKEDTKEDARVRMRVRMRMRVRVHVRVHVRVYVRMRVCVHVRVSVCVFNACATASSCMCAYVEKKRNARQRKEKPRVQAEITPSTGRNNPEYRQ